MKGKGLPLKPSQREDDWALGATGLVVARGDHQLALDHLGLGEGQKKTEGLCQLLYM